MDWKKLLAYISGSVDEELLLRNEYLVTENRILRNQIKGRLRLTDGERKTLAEIGKKLGKKVLEEVASIVKPETILAWHSRLVAKKFDGSKSRTYPEGDRRSTPRSTTSSSAWQRRIDPGVTIGSPAHWSSLATR